MPNNFYEQPQNNSQYQAPNPNKSPKKFKFGSLLAIAVVVVAIALSVLCAMAISDFITVGSFSFSKTEELKKNNFTIYAISVSQSPSKTGATSIADDVKKKGGAGFLYCENGTFHILASGYKEKADAEKVCEKLNSSGVSTKLLTIEVPSISISGLTQAQSTTLGSCISHFSSTFDKLYDMAIALDTSTSTESEVFTQLSSLRNTLKSNKQTFNSNFDNCLTASLVEVKIALSNLMDYVEEVIQNTSSTSLTSLIKHCYFKTVEQQIELHNILSA